VSGTTIALRYVIFAVIATIANLGTQRLVLSGGEGLFIWAVLAGTAVGLVVKYLLDKRWIFFDTSSGTAALYTVMGLLTTAIFWGMETAFWLTWRTDMMRELGAVIGLTIGYVVKYWLDPIAT